MKKNGILFVVGILIILGIFLYFDFFGAPQSNAEAQQFTVAVGMGRDRIENSLVSQGFVKNQFALKIVFALSGVQSIQPGAYKLSKAMGVWAIASALRSVPYMKWVTIPEGLRKEEIVAILAKALGWNDTQKQAWLAATATPGDYFEGVYFPDTYLIPVAESPVQTVARLQAKFQEKFAPYAKDASHQNIKWTTALKLASVIQREAAGKSDMPLVSGILWNRLLKHMPLQVDATVQYARGDTGNGWWAPLKAGDTKIDSPYNTYLHAGLPSHPIDNPGLDAIDAALHPASTTCLYYLHDAQGEIHCAATYAEHLRNIKEYLQ